MYMNQWIVEGAKLGPLYYGLHSDVIYLKNNPHPKIYERHIDVISLEKKFPTLYYPRTSLNEVIITYKQVYIG